MDFDPQLRCGTEVGVAGAKWMEIKATAKIVVGEGDEKLPQEPKRSRVSFDQYIILNRNGINFTRLISVNSDFAHRKFLPRDCM